MERRDFLKKAAMTLAGVSIAPTLIAKEDNLSHGSLDVRAVEMAWKKAKLPLVSLYVHEKDLLSSGDEFNAKVKQDFDKEKVLFIDGLVLSESESALIIYLNT